MTQYTEEWEYLRQLGRLVADGATLQDLADAYASVTDAVTPREIPARLHQLATVWTQSSAFVPIRLREVYGDLVVEHDDDYVLAMIGSMGGRRDGGVREMMLREDQALRDEVFWRIFSVEGGGEVSLANIDKFSPPDASWHQTVLDLAADGIVPRARLLRSCLEALNRDFSAYRAGWFSRMYVGLQPDATECAADQDLLRRSLGSLIPATVTFSMKHLGTIHRAGLLDGAAFIESAAPVMTGSKAAAIEGLKVLGALAAAEGVDADAIASTYAAALEHAHADVQRAGVKALYALDRADLVQDRIDVLAPAVAASLHTERVPAPVQTAPIDAVSMVVPPAEPVVPWSHADAVERYAALLEESADALEFELALGWIVADPTRARVTLEPLLRRARRLLERDTELYPASLLVALVAPAEPFLPPTIHRPVTTTWADGAEHVSYGEAVVQPSAEQRTVLPAFVTRLREVAAIVQGGSSQSVLLATPTDSHGGIDADVLLDRFRTLDGPALPVDLAQAIIRVRPEDRDRVRAETAADAPEITASFAVEWRSRGSESLKKDGTPQWTWWSPNVIGDPAPEPSALQPALIATGDRGWYQHYAGLTPLTTAELGLVDPSSTLVLAAAGLRIMHNAAEETSEHRAADVLSALARHPGRWTAETAQLVAVGMAAASAPLRSQAAELLVAAVPARIDVEAAGAAFAAVAPAMVLTRWASSFADAATLAPEAVVDVLTAALPQVDRASRGIGAVLTVLLDESVRLGRAVTDPVLRAWASGFSGSSAAAKNARALLRLGGGQS